jgi:hypothetical protein
VTAGGVGSVGLDVPHAVLREARLQITDIARLLQENDLEGLDAVRAASLLGVALGGVAQLADIMSELLMYLEVQVEQPKS